MSELSELKINEVSINNVDYKLEDASAQSKINSINESLLYKADLKNGKVPMSQIPDEIKGGGGSGNANIIELTQDEYDTLTEEKKNDGTIYVITDAPATNTTAGSIVFNNKPSGMTATDVQSAIEELKAKGGGGSTSGIEITQAEYDALSESQKKNGNIYIITDAPSTDDIANGIIYSNTNSKLEATNVQDAIDEIANNIAYEDISNLVTGNGNRVIITKKVVKRYADGKIELFVKGTLQESLTTTMNSLLIVDSSINPTCVTFNGYLNNVPCDFYIQTSNYINRIDAGTHDVGETFSVSGFYYMND